MRCYIILIILFVLPLSLNPSETEFDLDKYNEMMVEIEQFKRKQFIDELKYEIAVILEDVKYFNVLSINPDHLYFMETKRLEYNIPMNIYYRLVLKESWFGLFTLSPVGARGYMQVMPATFNWIVSRYELDISDINDPYDNIVAGTFYLNLMKEWVDERFPTDSEDYRWKRALASYNAGFSVHGRAMYRYNETRNYVAFILK